MAKQRYDYDLVVIGSGAGGGVAAHIMVKNGWRVAIIEPEMIGGECPNIGCVPTKALLQAAEIYEAAKNGGRFGIRGSAVGYNYHSIKAWKDFAVHRTGTHLGEKIYKAEGITLIKGYAHFIEPHIVSIGPKRITSANFLIATGSKISIPPIVGLKETGFLTFKEALDLTRPPRTLAIIGGGVIGCEFTQLFASFGTKITIIDIAPRLLGREEPEAADYLADRFSEEYGVDLALSTTVDLVEKTGAKKKLTLNTGGKKRELIVDEILVASGKRAVSDIGLENAGVKYSEKSITTDEFLQTNVPHIFAAGDCTGPYQFTHTATYQSRIVANNLLHPRKKIAADYHAVPRCTFTNPEIASVGKSEAELKEAGVKYKVATSSVAVIGRSNTADFRDGFAKILADAKTGILLGGVVVSPHAGEVIHELTLAVQNRLTASQVANTIHAFPTWSEIIRVVCHKLA